MGKGHLSFLEDRKQIYKQILKNTRLNQPERADSKALILAPKPLDVSVQEQIWEKIREDCKFSESWTTSPSCQWRVEGKVKPLPFRKNDSWNITNSIEGGSTIIRNQESWKPQGYWPLSSVLPKPTSQLIPKPWQPDIKPLVWKSERIFSGDSNQPKKKNLNLRQRFLTAPSNHPAVKIRDDEFLVFRILP